MSFVLAKSQVVAQRYRLERLLGEGGMGAVWAATHLVTRKPVALKFLKGVGASRADSRRRFLREARAASAVRHPNVVQIHDIFELEDGAPVMVMDLLVGESLGARLRRTGKLSAGELAAILVPAISAIGSAHAVGIVHRDLKPDNIFLVDLAEGKRDVRVLDFGIAKLTATEGDAAHTGGITQTGDMLGTPYYMAPEQAAGEVDIDHRADIWALGVIVYECLAGERPVKGSNIGQILKQIITGAIVPLADLAPALPVELTRLVGTMLSQDRAGRPADLREVQAVLTAFTDVSAQSFAAPGSAVTSAELPFTPDPFGSTTPGDGKVDLPLPSPMVADDPRWRAATVGPQSDEAVAATVAPVLTPTSPDVAPPARRSLPVWIAASFAVLAALALAAWKLSQPTPQALAPPPAAMPAPAATPTAPAAEGKPVLSGPGAPAAEGKPVLAAPGAPAAEGKPVLGAAAAAEVKPALAAPGTAVSPALRPLPVEHPPGKHGGGSRKGKRQEGVEHPAPVVQPIKPPADSTQQLPGGVPAAPPY